jgi:hypothetical protein
MSILNSNYRIETGDFGLAVITRTGRCTPDEVTGIEANVIRRWDLVPIPHQRGAVLRVLDGTTVVYYTVTPPTVAKSYTCVKVSGRCNPFAAAQPGGTYSGLAILSFEERYQEVGAVA